MTKTKRIWIKRLLLIFLVLIIAVWWGRIILKKVQEHQKDTRLKTIAVNFIKEKYGIEPGAQEATECIGGSYYAITLYEGNQKYYVFLNEETGFLADTYQYEEIKAALEKYIAETYPNCQYSYISIAYTPSEEILGYRFCLERNTYFDGSNLDEVLQDAEIQLTMYYAETEFADCALFQELQEWNTNGAFVSFDTQEHLEQYLDTGTILRPYEDEDIEHYRQDICYAPYIQQIWKLNKEKSCSTNYPLKEGNDFLYCCPAVPELSFGMEDATVLAMNIYGSSNREECENALNHAVSDAYQFLGSNWNNIYVYLPIAEFPDYDNCNALWFASNTGQNINSSSKLTKCGDYAVFSISAGENPAWMLVQQDETT